MSFVKSPKPADPEFFDADADGDNSIPILYFLLVALGASARSLETMAASYWQLVHPERILLVTGVVAGISCLAMWALVALGVRRKVALLAVLVSSILLVGGGPILRRAGPLLGWLAVVGAVILAIVVARAFSEIVVQGTAVVLVTALLSGALISGYEAWESMGSDKTVDSEPIDFELVERPDIYLVFLDAYTGFPALEDVLSTSKNDLIKELESLELQMPASAWSPYALTEAAIPAVLDMSYLVSPGDLTNSSRATLHDTIAGDSRTVDILRANGYRTTMIESGWVGSSCGPQFDECIASHWLDETMYHLASQSLAYNLVLERFGHAFTVNAIHTVSEIEEVASRSDGDGPDFVFAHVLAPHPPFFLDENCEISVDEVRVRQSFSQDPADEEWDALFLEQTRCVDEWVVDLTGSVGSDDIVILLGDHGIGRHPRPDAKKRPNPEVILEHQNVFLAVRTLDGCELTDPLLTSDLMRQVLSCLGNSPLQPVEDRMFVWGGYEMGPDEIDELMGMWVIDG